MSRIKKALALGLHCGGNEAEKKHAMQRATKLLQKHGLTQAGVTYLETTHSRPTNHQFVQHCFKQPVPSRHACP